MQNIKIVILLCILFLHLSYQQVCGNGIIEAGEQCEDGNIISGDGCSSSCLVETDVCVGGNAQYLDEFSVVSYSNSDGNALWNTTWVETGDDAMSLPSTGVVQINNSNSQLEIIDIGSIGPGQQAQTITIERSFFAPTAASTAYSSATIDIDITSVQGYAYIVSVTCDSGPGCASLPRICRWPHRRDCRSRR